MIVSLSWAKRSMAARAVSVHHVTISDDQKSMELLRDVQVAGLKVGNSTQKYIFDGVERELAAGDQSFTDKAHSSASINANGDILVKTVYTKKNGDKGTEEETRCLAKDDSNTMILEIKFTGEPDVKQTFRRVFRRKAE
jgi:hypothetical protein